MLPSFRLIAVTFLCGFLVVFAGLRLAASLNDIHEALPVMAAHAAPVSITPIADREARRGLASVPVMYDLRFAVSSVSPTLVRIAPSVMERPALPPSIAPHEGEAEQSAASSRLESTFAAIPPDPRAIPAPAVSPGEAAEPAKPEAPAVAAIDAQGEPPADARTIETVPTTIPPAAEIPAAAAKAEAIETRAATPSEGAAEPLQAEPDSTSAIEAPTDISAESQAATAPASATAAENDPGSPVAAAAPEPATVTPVLPAKAKIVRK